jgi:hypothetical protein
VSTKAFDNQYANNMASVAATSLGIGPGMSVNMSSDNHNMMLNHGQHQTVVQVKRVKQTKAQTQALSQSVVTNMSANVSNFSGNQNPLNSNSGNQYSGQSTTSGVNFSPFMTAQPPDCCRMHTISKLPLPHETMIYHAQAPLTVEEEGQEQDLPVGRILAVLLITLSDGQPLS